MNEKFDENFNKCCICGEEMELVETFEFEDGDKTYEFVCWDCNIGEIKLKKKEKELL